MEKVDSTKEVLKKRRWASVAASVRFTAVKAGTTGKTTAPSDFLVPLTVLLCRSVRLSVNSSFVFLFSTFNFLSASRSFLRGNARFEKPLRREAGRPGFEEAGGPGAPGRKDYTRADSDNWRTLREEQEEEEGEPGTNWRHGVPRRDGTTRPLRTLMRVSLLLKTATIRNARIFTEIQ